MISKTRDFELRPNINVFSFKHFSLNDDRDAFDKLLRNNS
jgi:hypothetical protein